MLAVYLLISAILLAVDQYVKWLTVTYIPLGHTVEFIPGFMSFTHLRNHGAAWSMFEGQMWFFIIVTVIVMSVTFFYLNKFAATNKIISTSLALIIAGGFGNLIDRVRLGFVIDMFQTEFIRFPIFNMADIFLVIGVFMLMIYTIWDERKNG